MVRIRSLIRPRFLILCCFLAISLLLSYPLVLPLVPTHIFYNEAVSPETVGVTSATVQQGDDVERTSKDTFRFDFQNLGHLFVL